MKPARKLAIGDLLRPDAHPFHSLRFRTHGVDTTWRQPNDTGADFPEPFGRLRCLEFTDPDAAIGLVGNLGERLPVRNYGYTLERWAREPVMALNALGVISKLPLSLFTLNAERQAGSTVAKSQCHICGVARDGRRLAASAVTGKGNFAMTAAAIATCAKTLLDRKDQGELPSGVLGVDDVFDLSEVKAGFEAQGIRITVGCPDLALETRKSCQRAVLATTLPVVEPFPPHRGA